MSSPKPPPPFIGIKTVPQVIEAISGFAGWCGTQDSRLGYFAALYLRITRAIQAAILQGDVFGNNALMARLDVTFANRYFTALNGYFYPRRYSGISDCWLASFRGAETAGDTVVQYMLSGVTAHIGLDLGIAAQQVCGSVQKLQAFQDDFDKVNEVLTQQVQGVIDDVDATSPVLKDLYALLGKHEIALISDAIGGFREVAWKLAVILSNQKAEQRKATVAAQDVFVAAAMPMIFTPLPPLETFARLIAQQENQDVAEIIQGLLPG